MNTSLAIYMTAVGIVFLALAIDIIWESWCHPVRKDGGFLSGHHPAALEICNALGLSHVRALRLDMESTGLAMVSVEQYLTVNNARKVQLILRRFKLIEDRHET